MLSNPSSVKTNSTIRWYVRGVGLCYLAAFATSSYQAGSLVLPDAPWPWVGCVAAAAVMVGILQLPMLVVCWMLYLLTIRAGGRFFTFQWDTLLLETGFLTLFVCPFGWTERGAFSRELPRTAIWIPRWLIFRLMFRSGLVKVLSGDPTWASLDAMTHHFETQPLPGPLSWYVHHLPKSMLRGLTAATLVIELVVPWLTFLGRKPRLVAAACFVLLQLGIIATGNYGFFNVLTIVLSVPLVDDRFLKRPLVDLPPARAPRRLLVALTLVAALFLGTFETWRPDFVSRNFLVNSYGLFAVMTTERREIEIEGSADGKDWRTYRLPYKPSAVDRAPPFLLFHMPRLDWLMWFAALGNHASNPWIYAVMEGLLKNDANVTRLFAENPFADRPPAFVRASFYRYTFTSPEEHAQTGHWWHREPLPPYLPVLSLKSEPAP